MQWSLLDFEREEKRLSHIFRGQSAILLEKRRRALEKFAYWKKLCYNKNVVIVKRE